MNGIMGPQDYLKTNYIGTLLELASIHVIKQKKKA